MYYTHTQKDGIESIGHLGRPDDYPNIEYFSGLLFFIQRNQNFNTVIYEANVNHGVLNLDDPIKINWVRFDQDFNMEFQELNYIQKKLAYGCCYNVISPDLVEFTFVSYTNMKFYLFRDAEGIFRVSTYLEKELVLLEHIYIYAEDLGVFPQVKFAEFYCKKQQSKERVYKKLFLQQ